MILGDVDEFSSADSDAWAGAGFASQTQFHCTQFTHQQMHYLLTWLKVLNLQYTIILLLHVSVFNDHRQGALLYPRFIWRARRIF